MPQNRTESGRFARGASGNPGGRPRKTKEQKDALEAIKDLSMEAVGTLKSIMEDKKAPASARIKAIEIILNRSYGMPKATAELSCTNVDFSALDAINYGSRRVKHENI